MRTVIFDDRNFALLITVEVGDGRPEIVDSIDGRDVWGIVWHGPLSERQFDRDAEVVVMRGLQQAQANARGFDSGR